jgi:hypothetical protein
VDYTGTGSAGPFTVPFPFYDASHLTVLQTDALFNQTTLTGWTATGAGGPSGAVTLAAACPVGSTLTIMRLVPLTQITSIKNQEAFYPEVHEQEMDLLAMADQQLDEAMDRTLRLPAGLSGVDMTLPKPDPGHALVWNAAGDGLENAGVASATLQQDLADSADVAKGDEMIAVKQPFTGAVSRTQHDKNAEWVSVLDAGADPTGATDSSVFFNSLSSKRYILVPDGTYLLNSPVDIQTDQQWYFQNAVLTHSDDTKTVLRANSKHNFSITGKLQIVGTLVTAEVAPEIGLEIIDSYGYRVENVKARAFKGCGIKVSGSAPPSFRGDQGRFVSCGGDESTVGIQIDAGSGSEFTTWSNTNCGGNITGLVIGGGNTIFHGGNIVDNTMTGVSLVSGHNHGHGIITGMNINHNNSENIRATSVRYGFSIENCHIYGNGEYTGLIWLDACKGIDIQGCHIDCKIYNDSGSGSGRNLIANNYFPQGYGVTLHSNNDGLSQLTLLNNFDNNGLSPLNDQGYCDVKVSRGGTDQVLSGLTTLIFNSVNKDKSDAYDETTGVFTAPFDGVYELKANLTFTGTGLTKGYIDVIKNSATYCYGGISLANAGDTIAIGGTSVEIPLNAGDTITIKAILAGTSVNLGKDTSFLTIKA